jgi:hypothetical protein
MGTELMYEVRITTNFGLMRRFQWYFTSQIQAEAWLEGHNLYHGSQWYPYPKDNVMSLEIELQYTDPAYRTFFSK